MAGVSYLAMFEADRDGKKIKETQFFSSPRARSESPKKMKEADEWLASKLREYGTHATRSSISKVMFCIIG